MKPVSDFCTYIAVVKDVYDGDTVTLDIYLGMGIWIHNRKCRLTGINAPELHTDGGQEAKRHLLKIISRYALDEDGKTILIQTEDDQTEKYGRLLVDLFAYNEPHVCLNEEMVKSGHAVRMAYTTVIYEGQSVKVPKSPSPASLNFPKFNIHKETK